MEQHVNQIQALVSLAVLVVNILLAGIVYRDARNLERTALGIPPILWSVAIVLSSVLGVLAYWLMHHSTLASRR